jgi:protein-serine/threonine kinase
MKYAQTEKDVLSIMSHPFIVRLNFAFQTETKLFLVMDFCPGGDLSNLLDAKRKLPEDVAKIYVAEILLALETLHKNNIIYRYPLQIDHSDLKPENVVLDSEGHAMLTDFGLSKKGVQDGVLNKSFCGSPAYLPPEILSR